MIMIDTASRNENNIKKNTILLLLILLGLKRKFNKYKSERDCGIKVELDVQFVQSH